MMLTTEGRSCFLAKELKANPDYKIAIGEDIIVGSGEVQFIETDDTCHLIEPDVIDLHWMAELIDAAEMNDSKQD